MANIAPTPEYQIYKDVLSFIKQYPQKSVLIVYDQPRSVRIEGFETHDNNKISTHQSSSRSSDIASFDDSLRRTKVTISDLVICNDFELFCTFTFDPKKSDRNNPIQLKNKMSLWLENQKKIHGRFEYLIVPEFHKDGKAIHFHALLKNYRGTLKKATQKSNNRETFNIKSYRLGFSTAVKIDNNKEKVASYVKKYITKDMPMFHGRKRFWCSQKLRRPIHTKNTTITPEYAVVYSTETYTIYEKIILIQSELPLITEAYIWHENQTKKPTSSLTTLSQEYTYGARSRQKGTTTRY